MTRRAVFHDTGVLDDGTGSLTVSSLGAQPLDSDLTAIAGLSPTNDDVIQRKAGAWTNRSMAQLAADLGVTTFDLAAAIHAATSKTTPVDNDELALVDSAASNVLKKLLWSNLKATLKTYFDTLYASSSGSAPIGTPELIYRYTVTGSDKASIDTGADTADAGSNDWTNGDLLEIAIIARIDESVTAGIVDITFNNDTGANYDREAILGSNATASASRANGQTSLQFFVPGASGASNFAGIIELRIPDYMGTTFYKVGTGEISRNDTTASQNERYAQGITYRSTSAITRLKIVPDTSGKKLKVGTQLLIYKRRAT